MASLITSIQGALTFIWGLFTDFLGMITSNNVLLYVVLVPIVGAVIAIVVKVLRKFGVR